MEPTEKSARLIWKVLATIILFYALQRTSNENSKKIFPEMVHSSNLHIHVSVSDLTIPTIDLPILLQEICGPILNI